MNRRAFFATITAALFGKRPVPTFNGNAFPCYRERGESMRFT